jgi:hypothetical protein
LDVELPVLVLTHVKSIRHKANVRGLELWRTNRFLSLPN